METSTTNHPRKLINPAGTEMIYDSMQFSQAVQVGNMMWVSGQVGMNEKFEVAEGIEAQTRQAFINLKKVLNEAGESLMCNFLQIVIAMPQQFIGPQRDC